MSTLQKILALALAGFSARSQNLETPQFKTDVVNVQVDAMATAQGRILHSLTPEDFVIREENQLRPILSFEEQTTPLDLVILLDTSWADWGNRDKNVRETAAKALGQMRAQDRTAVIMCGGDPHLEQELTSDSKKVEDVLRRIPSGPTAFSNRLTAIRWAAWLLMADAHASANLDERKRAILMVTGQNREIWGEVDDPVIQLLWNANIAFNSIVIPRTGIPGKFTGRVRGPRIDNINEIAYLTGGEIVTDSDKEALQKSLPDLLAHIQSSYSLWFSHSAEAKSGELRHIKVELSDEAKKKYPDAKITAREGYIAR